MSKAQVVVVFIILFLYSIVTGNQEYSNEAEDLGKSIEVVDSYGQQDKDFLSALRYPEEASHECSAEDDDVESKEEFRFLKSSSPSAGILDQEYPFSVNAHAHSDDSSNMLEMKRNRNRHRQNRHTTELCPLVTSYCWTLNHPSCFVTFPPSVQASENSCKVFVRCNYTTNLERLTTKCFAQARAFPKPELPGINSSTFRYNYTIRLYTNGTTNDAFRTVSDEKIRERSKTHFNDLIGEYDYDRRLGSYSISTSYNCFAMALCRPPQ